MSNVIQFPMNKRAGNKLTVDHTRGLVSSETKANIHEASLTILRLQAIMDRLNKLSQSQDQQED